ncbi:MAG: MBG domain-containing protein, partial [Pseudomonadota bacterium]|nr:MBG domain-containing protein [Pseudomonadota bacterium]
SSDNYNIVYLDGSLEITVASLTITANSQNKTYGDILTFTGSEFMSSGLLGSDSISTVSLASDGATNTANVGSYDIEASNASGSGLDNYAITYVDGILDVNPADLTITANNDSKVYDAVGYTGGNGVMYSGFVNGEDDSALSGTLMFGGDSQGATNVGSYTIAASGLSSSNYNIAYIDGNFDITQAELTITADNQSKTYGDTFSFAGTEFSSSGLVGSDSISSVSLSSAGEPNTANVGDYVIDIGSASGSGLSNYIISYVDGLLSVDPAELTITANDDSKQVDNVPYSGGNGVTYDGFVNGEDESVLFGTLMFGGDSQGAVDPGTYDIVPSGLTSEPQFNGQDEYYYDYEYEGSGQGNYNITYVDGTLTIFDADPDPVIPSVELDPLGRPIISVANQTIVLDEQFEEIETLELATDVGIASDTSVTSSPEALADIAPAAGGETAEELAGIAPAAGGDAEEATEDVAFANDLECGNSFLGNTPCDIDDLQ